MSVFIAVPLRAWLGFVVGLGLQAATVWAADALPESVSAALRLVAAGVLVYACSVVAQRKDYPIWVGMIGLLSALGVGMAVMLPPRDSLPRPWRRSVLPEDESKRRDEPRERSR